MTDGILVQATTDNTITDGIDVSDDGVTNARDDLENKESQITYAGFNYFINRFETVGISYQRGMTDGFSLQFRKLF